MSNNLLKAAVLTCGACDAALSPDAVNAPAPGHCPQCGAETEAAVFPAFFRELTPGISGEKTLFDDESSCFYHPSKKAVVPCDICGRFLCALCDVEMHGQHMCPSCIDAGKTKGKMAQLEVERMRWDAVALFLAGLGLLIWYFAPFTAPATLFIVIRHWRTTLSPVRPSRWRFVLAFFIAVSHLALLGVIVTMIIMEVGAYE